MSSRRKAREAVLKALYIAESRGFGVREAFKEMEAVDHEMNSQDADPDAPDLKPFSLSLDEHEKSFALSLALQIEKNRNSFNDLIRPVLKNWDFDRVSRIDRIIIWIALEEMLYMLDIPYSVSMNEAIEMAKHYSSEKSPAFINGILDTLFQQLKSTTTT